MDRETKFYLNLLRDDWQAGSRIASVCFPALSS